MDLIKESKGIHKLLLKRWDELELKDSQIIHDAEERGMHFNKADMSSYRRKCERMTQKQVLWLCFRYGIPVKLMIGNPKINKRKIIFEIPKYNQQSCLQKLEQHKDLFK